jgi:hypothetical protein
VFTREELDLLENALTFAASRDEFYLAESEKLLNKVKSLQEVSIVDGIGYPPSRVRDLWITVALFDGRVVHSEESWIKAHSEEGLAWDEARKNINGAREAGYSGTGTAIFEVEMDSGHPAMMSVLVGDKQ